jgi:hypothetical protein
MVCLASENNADSSSIVVSQARVDLDYGRLLGFSVGFRSKLTSLLLHRRLHGKR